MARDSEERLMNREGLETTAFSRIACGAKTHVPQLVDEGVIST